MILDVGEASRGDAGGLVGLVIGVIRFAFDSELRENWDMTKTNQHCSS